MPCGNPARVKLGNPQGTNAAVFPRRSPRVANAVWKPSPQTSGDFEMEDGCRHAFQASLGLHKSKAAAQ